MIGEQDVLGFIDSRRQDRRAADIGVQALHQAAVRLADIRRGSPRFKTKDLVGLLLSHGARTWRNTQPFATVRLRVLAPDGKTAVKIRL
ncbi:hypothetical protein EJ071_26130 [Mesorhizobium sp. M1B.F.Ca.ET.045.04.1.1]|nr:hypothetical protein EJ071_26130 [Mesorhizobium sp. M1B.F.Ca.ET.045.04.1.1]